jgi:galactose mutarotase-like enzyme
MPLQRCLEPYPHWLYRDPRSGDSLRIVPERGGLVSGWSCGGREILYLDAERFADPALSVRGGIPVLFPICGNLPGDRLDLPQGSFHLPQHGFARDLPWQLQELEAADGVVLVLEDSPESRAKFPFAFRLELELRLEPAALAITVRISHRREEGFPESLGSMPFSFGLHPYLAVVDPAAVRLEGLAPHGLDHHTMTATSTAEQLARLGQGVDLLTAPAGPVRLVDPLAGHAVTLETRAPWDQVVIWSDPPRSMVCLEPWTGPRGSLVTGDRRLELAVGQSQQLSCRYRVDTAD